MRSEGFLLFILYLFSGDVIGIRFHEDFLFIDLEILDDRVVILIKIIDGF